jgi:transposase
MASKSQLKTINEILKIEGMTVTAYQLITEIGCIIYLKNQQCSMACSNCGHLSNKLHQNHWLTVRDLPLGENPVYLKINRRQFKCLNCNRKFSEEFSFVKKRSSFTNRVKQKIVEEILSSDLKNVAKRNGLSEQEVETILKEIGADLTKKKPENLKRLGIDEIALVKGQKNYCAVLVDLDKKQLITILPKRTCEEITKCLKSWGAEVLNQIEEISIDMYKPYKSLAMEVLPEAEIVADRFHVMGQINDELDRERRKIRRESEKIEDRIEKEKTESAMVHSKYALLRNAKELNDLQKDKLKEIEEVLPELALMHKMKESFRDIFESRIDWSEALFQLCDWLIVADEKFPKSCGTIKRWIGEIISYFDNRTTQGAVEGINNKLKLIKRRGYGFRNFDNFQIRSMLSWHFNI